MNTKTTTTHTLYPQSEPDKYQLEEILTEICEVLRSRADGVDIMITRTNEFPPHNGKYLICAVEMKTWPVGE